MTPLSATAPHWLGFALRRGGFFYEDKMTDKKYEIKYAISSPERTGSGRPTSNKGSSKNFSVSASNVTEAKQKLRNSNNFKTAMERVERKSSFQEERRPRVTFHQITEQSKSGGKTKVVQESAFQKRVNRGGGGRAAAAVDSGRGGVTKTLQAKRIIPNT